MSGYTISLGKPCPICGNELQQHKFAYMSGEDGWYSFCDGKPSDGGEFHYLMTDRQDYPPYREEFKRLVKALAMISDWDLGEFMTCDYCGEYHHEDNILALPIGAVTDAHLCQICTAEKMTQCDECGKWISKNNSRKLAPVDGDCGAEYYVCWGCP